MLAAALVQKKQNSKKLFHYFFSKSNAPGATNKQELYETEELSPLQFKIHHDREKFPSAEHEMEEHHARVTITLSRYCTQHTASVEKLFPQALELFNVTDLIWLMLLRTCRTRNICLLQALIYCIFHESLNWKRQ